MSKRKIDALTQVAKRGGTENERKVASAKLSQAQASAIVKASETDGANRYTSQGVITRHRGEAKAYLRGESLAHFLRHVADGKEFTNRSIPWTESFGQGDYYVILGWMLDHGVCIKNGSRYTVPSTKTVRDAWNQQVEQMKL